jgi:hypothetical protein
MRYKTTRPELLRRLATVLAATLALAGNTMALAQDRQLEDLAAFPRGPLEINDGK